MFLFAAVLLSSTSALADIDACQELQVAVCNLCGEGEACESIKTNAVPGQSCQETLATITELEGLVEAYPEERDYIVGSYCSSIAELGKEREVVESEECIQLHGIVCSWCGEGDKACREIRKIGDADDCRDVLDLIEMLQKETGMSSEAQQAFCKRLVEEDEDEY